MPTTKERKEELIESYKQVIAGSQAIILAEYRGLTVPKMQKLRGNLREVDGSFIIAKKTLMSRALHESGLPTPDAAMIGPIGFAFLGEDLATGAKVLKDFAKEAGDAFIIHGGVLGQSVFNAAGAVALADLPSREVQLGLLLGAIVAPMSALASLVTGPHRDLIGLLQARIDKEGGEALAA